MLQSNLALSAASFKAQIDGFFRYVVQNSDVLQFESVILLYTNWYILFHRLAAWLTKTNPPLEQVGVICDDAEERVPSAVHGVDNFAVKLTPEDKHGH